MRNKYCLCICVEESLFFIINTDICREASQDTQIKIYTTEAEFLSYDSYVDTHVARTVPLEFIEEGARHAVYKISPSCLNRMKYLIEQHRQIPARIMKKIKENW